MTRQRGGSNASGSSSLGDLDILGGGGGGGGPVGGSSGAEDAQELGSMYDYLAKVILLGPSGAGKSCILHRFLRNEWRALTSQTIGVEFGSKVVALGTGARRTRLKLQLWDTAGTERFRAVSRSYYRGAAGAILIYDVASYHSFAALPNFLSDARALASPHLSTVLAGNKVDVDSPPVDTAATKGGGDGGVDEDASRPSTRTASLTSASSFAQADSDVWGSNQDEDEDSWDRRTERGIDIRAPNRSVGLGSSIPPTPSSSGSMTSTSTVRYALPGQQSATQAPQGREVDGPTASRWASSQGIPVNLEVSALNGNGVDEAFRRLAQIILTKIELGEIDPDDPQSGIQYGDSAWFDGGDDGGSIKSNGTGGGLRRRKGKSRTGTTSGLRDWEAVFRLDRGRSRRRNCC